MGHYDQDGSDAAYTKSKNEEMLNVKERSAKDWHEKFKAIIPNYKCYVVKNNSNSNKEICQYANGKFLRFGTDYFFLFEEITILESVNYE